MSTGTHQGLARPAQSLAEIALVLSHLSDSTTRVRRVLDLLREIVPCERCAILAELDGRTVALIAPELSPEMSQALSSRLAALQNTLVSTEPIEPSVWEAHLALPIVALDEVLGVLLVERGEAHPYGPEDLRLLVVVAAQLGSYLSNLRAHRARLQMDVFRRSVQLLEAVLENAPVGVFIKDLQGRYLLMNRVFGEAYGIDPAHAKGKLDRDLLPPALERKLAEQDERVMRTGAYQQSEERLSTGGAERIWRATRFPLKEGTQIYAVCAVIDDVTAERRTAEMRERFIAILSHDLRAPLNAIKLSSDLLLRLGALNEAQSRSISRIANNTARMTRMTSDLLDFTRGRLGGGIPVQRKPTDMEEICRAVVEEFSLAHPSRALSMQAWGHVRGQWDADRAHQVITNLLSNAVEHGQDPIQVTVEEAGDSVLVQVRNRGPPIPTEALSMLFEPFVKPDRRREGLGLGLYIAQEIMRAHGGRIDVRSTASDGTVFSTIWPRHSKTTEQGELQPHGGP